MEVSEHKEGTIGCRRLVIRLTASGDKTRAPSDYGHHLNLNQKIGTLSNAVEEYTVFITSLLSTCQSITVRNSQVPPILISPVINDLTTDGYMGCGFVSP
jgi:hypothetical protein